MKILLVEDEPDLATATQRLLRRHNYIVDIAENLSVARSALQNSQYEIVLLDRRLPDGDGVELIHFAQGNNLTCKFLVLSALGELQERIEGLDLGADDYMVKPFEPEELLARMRAAERRPVPEVGKVLEIGGLRLDCDSRNFDVGGETFILPRREMVILEQLIHSANRVVGREVLEKAMYGYDEQFESNTLESHMLRKSIADRACGVRIHMRGVHVEGRFMKKTLRIPPIFRSLVGQTTLLSLALLPEVGKVLEIGGLRLDCDSRM